MTVSFSQQEEELEQESSGQVVEAPVAKKGQIGWTGDV